MINYLMKCVLCGWLWSRLRTGTVGYYRFNGLKNQSSTISSLSFKISDIISASFCVSGDSTIVVISEGFPFSWPSSCIPRLFLRRASMFLMRCLDTLGYIHCKLNFRWCASPVQNILKLELYSDFCQPWISADGLSNSGLNPVSLDVCRMSSWKMDKSYLKPIFSCCCPANLNSRMLFGYFASDSKRLARVSGLILLPL